MMRRGRLTGVILCAVAVAFVPAGALAAPQSVSDFLKLKPRWEKMVGLKFLLEGRFGGSTGELLSLRHLPLPFRSDTEIPLRYRKDDVLHVMGQLQRDGNGQLYFQLLDVKKGPSDLERLQHRILDLPLRDPAPVYELADWALARGAFYKDAQLQQEARKLYDRGLRREAAAFKSRDYRSYRELAIKAVGYGLGEERKYALLYEGHYYQWQLVRRDATAQQLAGLATAIAAELPGAAVPLRTADEELRRKWRSEPLRTYETVPSGREQMHRFLYQDIMSESIQREALPDGRNGKTIARRFREELPEFDGQADAFVRKELDWHVRNVTTLPIDRMLKLREELLELDDPDTADLALRDWFRNRERQLRKEGIDGLIELSSLYETLFPGGARDAVRVLLEAERRRPGSSIVRQRLESHGYRQINGDWKSSDEVRDFENSPINRALREGRVIPGMTQDQVLRALGEPASITRLLTARHVIEYWIYGAAGRSGRLTIRLSRPPQRASGIVVDSREIGR